MKKRFDTMKSLTLVVVMISILCFYVPEAMAVHISNGVSCINAGGSWNSVTSTCTFSGHYVVGNAGLDVENGVTTDFPAGLSSASHHGISVGLGGSSGSGRLDTASSSDLAGDLLVGNSGELHNFGGLTNTGNSITNLGHIFNEAGATLDNFGTIINNVGATINNLGTLLLECGSTFVNSGNLVGIPPQNVPCRTSAVGGQILPSDMTALFVAGTLANAFWMIPTLGGIAGGTLVFLRVKRKQDNLSLSK